MLKKKGKSWRKKKGEDSFTLKAKVVEANEEVYSSDRSESNQNSKSESNVNSRSEGKTNGKPQGTQTIKKNLTVVA